MRALGFRVVAGALAAGCGESCPQTLEARCAQLACPDTVASAALDPCDDWHSMVYVEGDATVIGLVSGSSSRTYHFQDGVLVGLHEFTDALDEEACPTPPSGVFGRPVISWTRLMTLEGRCSDVDQTSCVPACTLCAENAEALALSVCDENVQRQLRD